MLRRCQRQNTCIGGASIFRHRTCPCHTSLDERTALALADPPNAIGTAVRAWCRPRWFKRLELDAKGNVMPSRNRQTALLTVGGLSLLLAARAAVRKWREYSLRDRVVLITGGSRGLGLVIARDMLRQGAKVAICARDGAELERAFNDLGQDHRHVLTVPCDVTDREQVHAMVGLVQQHFGAIDVLIN